MGRIHSFAIVGTLLIAFAQVAPVRGQDSPQPSARSSGAGLVWVEQFAGSANQDGQVTALTSTTGYNFNSHFGVVAGVPLYFVRGVSSSGTTSAAGFGDLFGGFNFALANPLVNYRTSLIGAAPTGAASKGLGTGHFTFDWTNRFDRRFGRWTPMLAAGLGNSSPNTLFNQQEFLSYGYVAHIQAGTAVKLIGPISAVASAYAIEPWGTQTAFSRVVGKGVTGLVGTLTHGHAFEQNQQSTGQASLTRDNGVNGGLDLSFASFDVWAGYSRSFAFDLNSVYFGLGVNVARLLRSGSAR